MTGGDRVVRVASGQGFWGDWQEAPKLQVRHGPIDYLMLDYLAEITMSILQKQRVKDPSAGYARDFVPLILELAPELIAAGVRVVSNAGGVNPRACRDALATGLKGVKTPRPLRIAIVTGDDLMSNLDDLLESGHELRNMETGEPLSVIRDRVYSANAYIGMEPILEALRNEADVIVMGRSTDTALTYGPLAHEFGWARDDWDRLAAGVVAGHINECGAQAAGGNTLFDWEGVDLVTPGYPIIEASPDGSFVVTKHPDLGGRVSWSSVTEQLVYEMGDPAEYITPDCVADFGSATVRDLGSDRVRVSGVRGGPRTDLLKVSIAYHAGFKASGSLTYAWPDALAKAERADGLLRARLERAGLSFEEVRTEYVGAGACLGLVPGPSARDLPEVGLRVSVRAAEREPVEQFTREIAPLILAGPPSVTGFAGGRPRVQDVMAYWPALIDRTAVEPQLEVEVTDA